MHKYMYNQAKDDHVNVVLVSMKWQQFKFYILTKLKKTFRIFYQNYY